MKYIILETDEGVSIPVIFPDHINHDEMAQYMVHIQHRAEMPAKPISAGFVSLMATCYGRSETLGINSRENIDSVLITYNESVRQAPVDMLADMLPMLLGKIKRAFNTK